MSIWQEEFVEEGALIPVVEVVIRDHEDTRTVGSLEGSDTLKVIGLMLVWQQLEENGRLGDGSIGCLGQLAICQVTHTDMHPLSSHTVSE